MFDRLKLVYGAVQERSLLSVLSHFYIYDGRVQATDGRMSIDAPLPELAGIAVTVPADRFLAAVEASEDEPKVEVKDGRILITSGAFKARIPIMPQEAYARAEPNDPDWEPEEAFLPTLRRLRPFIASDATNAWSTCLLLTSTHAYATNNVCLVGEPCSLLDGTDIESLAIPAFAIDEIIRLGQEPTKFGVSDNAITFYFDDTWLRTQLIIAPWPAERITQLFAAAPKKQAKLPTGFREALDKVSPFCKDTKFPVVICSGNGITTEEADHMAEVQGLDLPEIKFNANMLKLVLAQAESFAGASDHKAYFRFGPSLGIIMGLRE
jgi:DNA polymerase III sliding clamp (beta) subunit (PCNA family)